MRSEALSYTGILLVNNLQLGQGRTPGRLDTPAKTKLYKLEWLADYASSHSLAVVLTGKVFNQTASFPDLVGVLGSECLFKDHVFIFPNYPGHLKDGSVSPGSILGVVSHVYPDKVISGSMVVGEKRGICLTSDRHYASVADDAHDSYVILTHHKRGWVDIHDHNKKRFVNTYSEAFNEVDGGFGLASVYRDRFDSAPPQALVLTPDSHEWVEVAHAPVIFDEEVTTAGTMRQRVSELSAFSVGKEFDPRDSHKGGEGTVRSHLDSIYAKDGISNDAYNIIVDML